MDEEFLLLGQPIILLLIDELVWGMNTCVVVRTIAATIVVVDSLISHATI